MFLIFNWCVNIVYLHIHVYTFESSDPHGLSISLGNPACSVDSFEATPAQGIKRCRPISESPFGWSSGELIQLIHLNW